MNISIRKMQKKDIKLIVDIITSHEKFDGLCANRYYMEYFNLANPEREEIFVAIDDRSGEVVGVCGYYPDKYFVQGILWLNWFYVAKSHIAKGVGRKLFEYTLNKVKSLNTRKLYLDTSNSPVYERARKFYEKRGFQIEGVLKDYYNSGEDYLIYGMKIENKSP